MAERHARKLSKDLFCAIAGTPCPCGENYIENCRPQWGDPATFEFRFRQARTGTVVSKVFEAHHLLCVASVGSIVIGDKDVDAIVRATDWCVNESVNMYAMPLWGHTVKWYCNIGVKLAHRSDVVAPPFADIPQHDWDHTGDGGYIEELEPELKSIVSRVQSVKKKHEVAAENLAAELRKLSADFRARLQARGLRSGGTHAGWAQGRADAGGAPAGKPVRGAAGRLSGRWYYPFSMASDGGVTAKAYPNLRFDDEALAKLKWLANKLKGVKGG